jgi:hypothetical protein
MLTNMLIYLGVVLFTFNLLDPSKIDASYLAKRGFTAIREPQREEDTAFEALSKQRRQDQRQAQSEIIDSSKLGPKQNSSPAVKLSEANARNLATSSPAEPEKPKAALTQSSLRSGGTTIRSASSRLYSDSVYPQATLPSYSLPRLSSPRPLSLEAYATLQVELASGINIPTFSLPSVDPAGAYLYRVPDPIPEASRGGLKLSAPPVGAESLYTNGIPRAGEKPPVKDQP